jgi:mannose-6-phosphate isomerase class I
MAAPTRSTYDLEPTTDVAGFDAEAFRGVRAVQAALVAEAENADVVVVECYPGVSDDVCDLVREAIRPDVVVRSEDAFYDGDELTRRMQPYLTDDRVRGVMYHGAMEDFIDPQALADARSRVGEARASRRRVLVFGVGATLVEPKPDLLVYCDLARWEIQLRYRAGMPNFKQQNRDEDVLRKVKRGYFVEWRIADRRKAEVFGQVDWFLDTNVAGDPRLVSGGALRAGLAKVARQPFRLVPYFDPGVWGGHWMQERFGLDPSQPNYAWSFDGVPEENSLYLRFGDVRVEVPAQDLTLTHPLELLGEQVFARFGAEFPIRFDFLDTMGGQNLSLQVHPRTDYIRDRFGMAYTQDESYYILDAGEGAGVYLGVRDGVDPSEMMAALRAAQEGGEPFDAERFVNRFDAHRHDHFLIPAGTVHCSAANTVVLEVSATPYNFTFKMWDWGRVGLDGLPRPIHLDDAERNICWDRRTDWCREQLVNAFEEVASGAGWREEHTGLHELEFLETRRITTTVPVVRDATEGVRMLNLVDGTAALVESPTGAFAPFEVHYAETFIVPAAAGRYVLRPAHAGEKVTLIEARVRES